MSTIRVHGLGGVNLLGRAYVAASYQRRLFKRWSKGLLLYVVVLAGLAMMLWGRGGKGVELQEASQILDSKIESRTRELAEASTRAAALRKQLRAAEAVGQHPDWGGVLAVVATKANGRVVLTGMSLGVADTPKTADAAAKAAKPKAEGTKEAGASRTATIVLFGQAQGLANVTDYAILLEEMNLFDSVKVKDSADNSSGTGGTTRFEIVCKMEERKIGGKP